MLDRRARAAAASRVRGRAGAGASSARIVGQRRRSRSPSAPPAARRSQLGRDDVDAGLREPADVGDLGLDLAALGSHQPQVVDRTAIERLDVGRVEDTVARRGTRSMRRVVARSWRGSGYRGRTGSRAARRRRRVRHGPGIRCRDAIRAPVARDAPRRPDEGAPHARVHPPRAALRLRRPRAALLAPRSSSCTTTSTTRRTSTGANTALDKLGAGAREPRTSARSTSCRRTSRSTSPATSCTRCSGRT